jgi:hypothetical protein
VSSPHQSSRLVKDRNTIESFIANPNNTFLVSFPRTGSHWLRMLMELHFGRPSLQRVFYYPERTDYLTLHVHDLELDVARSHVIYLYRDPVATVYSHLRYKSEDIDSREKMIYWSRLYGLHLYKWLHEETFTKRKTVIRYERLQASLSEEFGRVCDHFGSPLRGERLQAAAAQVSKEHVRNKTLHDPQVINLTQAYATARQRFQVEHGQLVMQVVLDGREELGRYLLGRDGFADTENPCLRTRDPSPWSG